MKMTLNIMSKTRTLLCLAAAIFVILAMWLQKDALFIGAIAAILLAVAADITVLILQRKLNIPQKKRENFFTFRKRK